MTGTVFRFAGFELEPQRAELRGADGGAIKLRPKTFEMLRLFAGNPGRVLSKQELLDAIWPNLHVSEDSLFQCIREIRTALGDDQRQMVKNVSGRGYLFAVEVKVEADAAVEAAPAARIDPVTTVAAPSRSRWRPFGLRGPWLAAAAAGLCAIIGIAVAAPILKPDLVFKRTPSSIAVMPIGDASNDPDGGAMAGSVTDRLTDGFARIDNIRVVTARAGAPEPARAASPDFVVQGELQKGPQSWTLQARMIRTATGEVQAVATVSVATDEPDAQRQQIRLAAGIGDALARRLNGLLEGGTPPAATGGDAKVVIEQAIASINQTSRERFAAAQTMLENGLAAEPDNVDLQVTLAALQLRGIAMVWYGPAESAAAEANARSLLERALRAKPNHIPVLEAYCRFLTVTNQFVDSLVACAKALSFDPWNGLALYHIGLTQLYLGRFEDALASFKQADRFDTPAVSRWTWSLGAGWASMLMGRAEEAVPWLQRSIAITSASGRTHMLLAAAYQQMGRAAEAKATMTQARELRPGSTAINVPPPSKNASPAYREATDRIMQLMVAAGLPES